MTDEQIDGRLSAIHGSVDASEPRCVYCDSENLQLLDDVRFLLSMVESLRIQVSSQNKNSVCDMRLLAEACALLKTATPNGKFLTESDQLDWAKRFGAWYAEAQQVFKLSSCGRPIPAYRRA